MEETEEDALQESNEVISCSEMMEYWEDNHSISPKGVKEIRSRWGWGIDGRDKRRMHFRVKYSHIVFGNDGISGETIIP